MPKHISLDVSYLRTRLLTRHTVYNNIAGMSSSSISLRSFPTRENGGGLDQWRRRDVFTGRTGRKGRRLKLELLRRTR